MEDHLMVLINSFASGGSMIRMAWGRTIKRINFHLGSPRALPASHCPVSIAWIPARTISAM